MKIRQMRSQNRFVLFGRFVLFVTYLLFSSMFQTGIEERRKKKKKKRKGWLILWLIFNKLQKTTIHCFTSRTLLHYFQLAFFNVGFTKWLVWSPSIGPKFSKSPTSVIPMALFFWSNFKFIIWPVWIQSRCIICIIRSLTTIPLYNTFFFNVSCSERQSLGDGLLELSLLQLLSKFFFYTLFLYAFSIFLTICFLFIL